MQKDDTTTSTDTPQPEEPAWVRMTKEDINELPINRYEGIIHVVRTEREVANALALLEKEVLLGFDTETKPSYQKGENYLPTLLQLAGENEVFLFQLQHTGFTGPLLGLLENPGIIKTGVSLSYDIRELSRITEFKADGFVDLGDVAKEAGIQNHGLRGLAAVLLGFRISKNAQTSNWANDQLTSAQITYAATDAWVGREIYKKMLGMGCCP